MGKYWIPFLGGSVAVILAGSALAATPAFAGVKGNYNLVTGNWDADNPESSAMHLPLHDRPPKCNSWHPN